MLIAGDQVPVMLFVEVVGNAGTLAPLQYGPTAANVGVVDPVTVMIPEALTLPHPPVNGML